MQMFEKPSKYHQTPPLDLEGFILRLEFMLHFSRRDKMYEYIEILSLRIKYRILSLLYAIKVIRFS